MLETLTAYDPPCVVFFSNSLGDTDKKGFGFCHLCKARFPRFLPGFEYLVGMPEETAAALGGDGARPSEPPVCGTL